MDTIKELSIIYKILEDSTISRNSTIFYYYPSNTNNQACEQYENLKIELDFNSSKHFYYNYYEFDFDYHRFLIFNDNNTMKYLEYKEYRDMEPESWKKA